MTIDRSIVCDCLVMTLREGVDTALASFPELEPCRNELDVLVELDECIDELEAKLRRLRVQQDEAEQELYLAACGEAQ